MACSGEQKERRIILLGKTGTGKSRTGNTILGLKPMPQQTNEKINTRKPTPFEFESKGSSVTKTTLCKKSVRFGKEVLVVDTPGVFDTNPDINNHVQQQEIKKCIGYTLPGPHAILLCIPVGRFTELDVKTIKHFLWYFGFDLLKYIIVVFNQVDKWREEYEDKNIEVPSFDNYIESLPDYLKIFLKHCGNRYVVFNNRLKEEESEKQVRALLNVVDDVIASNKMKCYSNTYYIECQKIVEKEISRQQLLDWYNNEYIWKKIYSGLVLYFHTPPVSHELLTLEDIEQMTKALNVNDS